MDQKLVPNILYLTITFFVINITLLRLSIPTNKDYDGFIVQRSLIHQNLKFQPTEISYQQCKNFAENDLTTADKTAIKLYSTSHRPNYLNFYNSSISNCTAFKSSRKYLQSPNSKTEAEFPLAFSIVIHKDFPQFERLLRAIYQPQHKICVHIDQKADKNFINQVKNLISCFKNVFEPRKKTKVYYAHYSRLEADLFCLQELKNYDYKYVFNLCGQDFPIKTNAEIVRDLTSLNGRNEIESVDINKVGKLGRVLNGYKLDPNAEDYGETLVREPSLDKPHLEYGPLGLKTGLFAGSAYFLLSKKAADYVVSDDKVAAFLNWSKNSYSPDEHVWATLQRYHGFPGSIPPHERYDSTEVLTRTRLVKWVGLDRVEPEDVNTPHKVALYEPCGGRTQRGVCIYGLSDLPFLIKSRHWFANKFDFKIDATVIDCLDVYLRGIIRIRDFRF